MGHAFLDLAFTPAVQAQQAFYEWREGCTTEPGDRARVERVAIIEASAAPCRARSAALEARLTRATGAEGPP